MPRRNSVNLSFINRIKVPCPVMAEARFKVLGLGLKR